MYRVEDWSKKIPGMGAAVLRGLLPFVSTDETRHAIMYVNVSGLWVQATDGHKAARFLKHRLGVKENVPDGSYTVAKEGKDLLLVPAPDAGQFPNTDQVFPKTWRRQFSAATGGRNQNAKDVALGGLAFKLARAGVLMNLALLKALPDDDWRVGVNGPLRPVILQGTVYEVVLMPMRGDSKGAAFKLGKFEREPYREEAEEAERVAALKAQEEAAAAAVPAPDLDPAQVAADVAALNAALNAPSVCSVCGEPVDTKEAGPVRCLDCACEDGQPAAQPVTFKGEAITAGPAWLKAMNGQPAA